MNRDGFILLLAWLVAVAGAPLLYHVMQRNFRVDDLHWIEYYSFGSIRYAFIPVWLAPVGVWFWLVAAVCLARSGRSAGGRWRHAALALWCLPWGVWVGWITEAMLHVDSWLYHRGGIMLPSIDPLLGRIDTNLSMALVLSSLITAGLLAWITRSRRIAIVTVAAAPLGAPWGLLSKWDYTLHAAVAAWFGITGGALILWSRATRRADAAEPLTCPTCGYDLRGIPVPAPCPECGTSVPRSQPSITISSPDASSHATPSPQTHTSPPRPSASPRPRPPAPS